MHEFASAREVVADVCDDKLSASIAYYTARRLTSRNYGSRDCFLGELLLRVAQVGCFDTQHVRSSKSRLRADFRVRAVSSMLYQCQVYHAGCSRVVGPIRAPPHTIFPARNLSRTFQPP